MKIKTIREDQNYIKISKNVKKLKHTLLFQYIDDLSMNQRSFMNHGLCPIDHKVMMRVAAGSELKIMNSKKSEKSDGENRVLIISY